MFLFTQNRNGWVWNLPLTSAHSSKDHQGALFSAHEVVESGFWAWLACGQVDTCHCLHSGTHLPPFARGTGEDFD